MFSREIKGKGIIVSAPSGAGKTTIVRHLLKQDLDLAFSISATNRVARGEEKNGEDYYFLETKEFKSRIFNEEFLEWEEVYEDQFYGTLFEELQRIWQLEKHVIFDVDVIGGLNLKKKLGKNALSIFIKPPSMKVLSERLKSRKTDSKEQIERRLSKAHKEIAEADNFDMIILNDDLETSCAQAYDAIQKFLR